MMTVFSNLETSLQPELSPQLAQESVKLYDQFLQLCGKYADEALVPPQLADMAWHKHLEMNSYAADVQGYCGRVVEHQTDQADSVQEQGWARTKALYQSEFGIDLSTLSDAAQLPASCNG